MKFPIYSTSDSMRARIQSQTTVHKSSSSSLCNTRWLLLRTFLRTIHPRAASSPPHHSRRCHDITTTATTHSIFYFDFPLLYITTSPRGLRTRGIRTGEPIETKPKSKRNETARRRCGRSKQHTVLLRSMTTRLDLT
mmetsp:Transcript_11677/g.27756  ORF Transcript_11677/g.27756 Transcript_11677/m.27756 type:complete len:137 (-) Transcript_11677:31-441(-)